MAGSPTKRAKREAALAAAEAAGVEPSPQTKPKRQRKAEKAAKDAEAEAVIARYKPPRLRVGQKLGRPRTSLTDNMVAKVEEWAYGGMSKRRIAWCLSMHPDTLQAIMLREPRVMLAYERGRAMAIGELEMDDFARARNGDPYARERILRTLGGWSEKFIVEEQLSPDFEGLGEEARDVLASAIDLIIERQAEGESPK